MLGTQLTTFVPLLWHRAICSSQGWLWSTHLSLGIRIVHHEVSNRNEIFFLKGSTIVFGWFLGGGGGGGWGWRVVVGGVCVCFLFVGFFNLQWMCGSYSTASTSRLRKSGHFGQFSRNFYWLSQVELSYKKGFKKRVWVNFLSFIIVSVNRLCLARIISKLLIN